MVLLSMRMTVLAMMGAQLFIALALFFVLDPAGEPPGAPGPPLAVLAGLVVGAVLLFLLTEAVGYRAPATTRDPVAAFTTGTFLRAVLGESLALVGLALSFLVDWGGFTVYLVAAVLSLALMGFHAFPWRRPIDKTEEALRGADVRNDLRERLGLSTGPVREL